MSKIHFGPLKTIFVVTVLLLSLQVTHAQYHLLVDVYDSTNVTFSATEELALADDATTTMFDGIALKNFFTVDWSGSFGPGNGEGPQTLRPNGVDESEAYTVFETFNGGGTTTQDLNIYRSSSVIQNFSTSARALIGVMSDDFSASPLLPVASTGDIVADAYFNGPKIGEYIIVKNYPKPHLTDFSYDADTGIVTVTIKAKALTAYKLLEADDLDFSSPEQDPIPLSGASVGTLNGNNVTTTAGGLATIEFNLGNSKPASFFRAQEVP